MHLEHLVMQKNQKTKNSLKNRNQAQPKKIHNDAASKGYRSQLKYLPKAKARKIKQNNSYCMIMQNVK